MAATNGWSSALGSYSSSDDPNLPNQQTPPQHQHKYATLPSTPNTQGRPASCIPLVYRIWHLWIEPCMALGGTYKLHWRPEQYFAYMPRTSRYAPEAQMICDQLASTYLMFAIIEIFVLRVADDVRMWKAVIIALAACDAGHIHATWAAMGTQEFLSPWMWQGNDALTMVLSVAPFLLRLGFLLELGLKNGTDLRKTR
ncbi:hypothetical protein FB567DRAFT_148821 [Paraphoma chrysanthemicola]|uniref:DUF7704 domain-containing protein n=1 Tax=Paraphoma chrysanthemicola TaxID=798071 RepID=A0A8K0QYG9_9PLEO|nr:hypothetical protein FB567DRAFT_148821 [Paraphoma chrysanthemicola]